MSQSVILAAALLFLVAAIALADYAHNQSNARRCPESTYYVREADACVYGIRPWTP